MSGPVDTTVVWLTFRQLFVRRRLVLAALFSLAPLVIALLFRASRATGAMDSAQFLCIVYRDIVVGTLLPLAAVVFGTTAFGGEVDDGTIVYLLVKPLARWRVVLSKYAAAVIATTAVMVPAVFLPWPALSAGTVAASLPLAFAAGVGIGAALYCAIFVTLGLNSRRALVLGLLYIVVLEFTMSRTIAGVKSLSVREFVLTTVAKLESDQAKLVGATVSIGTVWIMGAVILVASLGLAIRRLGTYEMAERL
jgi:ABC-2 type transport system permease protein